MLPTDTNPAQTAAQEALTAIAPLEQSTLPLLGTRQASNDLLDEVMHRSKDEAPSKGFGDVARDAHGRFSPEAKPEAEAAREATAAPEPAEAKEVLTPQRPTTEVEDTPAPEPQAKESDSSYFHVLNEQHQAVLQRQENFERALMAETQRNQQLMQQLTAKEPEINWQDYDFSDPAAVKAFQDKMRAETQRQVQQAQLPILHQLVDTNFGAAIARAKEKFPHFDKYFKEAYLQQYIGTLKQQFHPGRLAHTNWDNEFAQAYRAADYDRLLAESQKASTKATVVAEKKEATKVAQKANLALVPKGTAGGAPGRPGVQERLRSLNPRLSFRQYGSELKREYFGT